jgi:hypothetical protein
MLCPCHVCADPAGEDDVTSGASSDLKQATALARAMVTKYGMSSSVGQVSLDYEDDGRSISSETRALIEKEVRELVQVGGACVGLGGGGWGLRARPWGRQAAVHVCHGWGLVGEGFGIAQPHLRGPPCAPSPPHPPSLTAS